jgi:hypothetical protein
VHLTARLSRATDNLAPRLGHLDTLRVAGGTVAVVSIVKEYYRVGDRVTISGLYKAVHSGHRKHHSVIAVRGDEFPRCRFCKDAAVFILVEIAPYIAHDLDFAGPSMELQEG